MSLDPNYTPDQQNPWIWVFDSKEVLYQYQSSVTNDTLSEDNNEHVKWSDGDAEDDTVKISDDTITYTEQFTEADGTGYVRNWTINRVNLDYSTSSFGLPSYDLNNSTDGTCTIVAPKPLGLTAKQQF
jgi:hypothetical protein